MKYQTMKQLIAMLLISAFVMLASRVEADMQDGWHPQKEAGCDMQEEPDINDMVIVFLDLTPLKAYEGQNVSVKIFRMDVASPLKDDYKGQRPEGERVNGRLNYAYYYEQLDNNLKRKVDDAIEENCGYITSRVYAQVESAITGKPCMIDGLPCDGGVPAPSDRFLISEPYTDLAIFNREACGGEKRGLWVFYTGSKSKSEVQEEIDNLLDDFRKDEPSAGECIGGSSLRIAGLSYLYRGPQDAVVVDYTAILKAEAQNRAAQDDICYWNAIRDESFMNDMRRLVLSNHFSSEKVDGIFAEGRNRVCSYFNGCPPPSGYTQEDRICLSEKRYEALDDFYKSHYDNPNNLGEKCSNFYYFYFYNQGVCRNAGVTVSPLRPPLLQSQSLPIFQQVQSQIQPAIPQYQTQYQQSQTPRLIPNYDLDLPIKELNEARRQCDKDKYNYRNSDIKPPSCKRYLEIARAFNACRFTDSVESTACQYYLHIIIAKPKPNYQHKFISLVRSHHSQHGYPSNDAYKAAINVRAIADYFRYLVLVEQLGTREALRLWKEAQFDKGYALRDDFCSYFDGIKCRQQGN